MITLETANAIFVDQKYSLKATFKNIMKDVFQSDTVKTDFIDATKSTKEVEFVSLQIIRQKLNL